MSSSPSNLSGHLDLLRRQWWLIVLVTALALGAAALVTALQTPVYRASAKIVVGQGNSLFQPQFGNAVDPFTQTMSTLLKSNVVATRVIGELRLDTTPERLLSHLHVATRPNSGVLEVSYDSRDRAQARNVLAKASEVFTSLVKQKLAESEKGAVAITATVFDGAHLQKKQVSPKPVRNLAVAGVLGLALGLMLAFARGSLDTRVRTRKEAEEWYGLPVIGALPKGVRGTRAIALSNGARRAVDERALDSLQLLRANLEFAETLSGTTLLVTSALPDEGKSTVTANLAVVLASAGKNVICVEADLRRPKLVSYLGMENGSPGLAEVVEGTASLASSLRDVPLTGFAARRRPSSSVRWADPTGAEDGPPGRLRVLMSGQPHGEPSELLSAERVARLVKDLRGRADYVLFDAPPILIVGDAFPLARTVDGVIVVARGGRSTRESAEAVRSTLQALSIMRAGVVLTDWDATEGYGYAAAYTYARERASAPAE